MDALITEIMAQPSAIATVAFVSGVVAAAVGFRIAILLWLDD